MALLTEMRAAQEELGTQIGKRGLAAAEAKEPEDPLAFAQSLGSLASRCEVRATHRRKKGKYKTRMPMPSKLDPHLATIEGWLATEPQLTALSITRRLAVIDPATFGNAQHSIVQRLLRRLRKQTALHALAELEECENARGGGDNEEFAGPPKHFSWCRILGPYHIKRCRDLIR